MSPPIITLTTDFGLADGFVGTMKGVILGICADARLVDISHDIPPQDVQTGGLVLKAAYPYFPKGTVHLAVVDPGVGGDRRWVIVEDGAKNLFVGPDNGLFTFVLEQDDVRVFEVENRRWCLDDLSATFHGRDVFAPVAARLASGANPSEAGSEISDAVTHSVPVPLLEIDEKERRARIHGIILHIDRFGNLVTNVDRDSFEKASESREVRSAHVILKNRKVADLAEYYEEAGGFSSGALFNSWGLLEVFVPSGNAAHALNAKVDEHVTIEIGS